MSGPRGTFAAIPSKAHHSPPLAEMRRIRGPLEDVYYYRAMLFCKEYLRSGWLVGQWQALASFANWPDDASELAEFFRRSGLVSGEKDLIWEWDEYNGWLIARAREEADRKKREREVLKKKRLAGIKSGKARRAKAKRPGLKKTRKRPKLYPDPRVVASQRANDAAERERVANGKETPER